MRVAEMRRSEGCSVIEQIEVASPLRQQYLAGNGAHFSLVLELETIGRTEEGSKANDDGANRWCSFPRVAWIFPPPCDSAANLFRVGLIGVQMRLRLRFFMEALLSARAG